MDRFANDLVSLETARAKVPDNTQPNHSVESIPRSKPRKKRRTANNTDTKAARSFHVTLRLRAEHIAKLWVRRATPHNVAVWSSETKQWVPLLAVSTLREAIAQAYEVEARQEDSTDTQVIGKPTSLAPQSAAYGTPAAPEAGGSRAWRELLGGVQRPEGCGTEPGSADFSLDGGEHGNPSLGRGLR